MPFDQLHNHSPAKFIALNGLCSAVNMPSTLGHTAFLGLRRASVARHPISSGAALEDFLNSKTS